VTVTLWAMAALDLFVDKRYAGGGGPIQEDLGLSCGSGVVECEIRADGVDGASRSASMVSC